MTDTLEAATLEANPAASLEATPAIPSAVTLEAIPAAPVPGTVTPEMTRGLSEATLADLAAMAPEDAYAILDKTFLDFNVDSRNIKIQLRAIPDEIRMRLLRTAVRGYVTNRISTAKSKTDKENAAWKDYELAIKTDPLQTVVAMPTEPKKAVDYADTIEKSIKALLSGELGKREAGDKKPKVMKDPLITQITKAVVADVYAKNYALDNNYKYPSALKEVGSDGLGYLKANIEKMVAAGAERAPLEKHLEQRYITPAKILLGQVKAKGSTDVSLI
jgi:hypothetical protein